VEDVKSLTITVTVSAAVDSIKSVRLSPIILFIRLLSIMRIALGFSLSVFWVRANVSDSVKVRVKIRVISRTCIYILFIYLF
jgi:hypothetical protein